MGKGVKLNWMSYTGLVFSSLLFISACACVGYKLLEHIVEQSLSPRFQWESSPVSIGPEVKTIVTKIEVAKDMGIAFSTGGYKSTEEANESLKDRKYSVGVCINGDLTSFPLSLSGEELRTFLYYTRRKDGRYEVVWRLPNQKGNLEYLLIDSNKAAKLTSVQLYRTP